MSCFRDDVLLLISRGRRISSFSLLPREAEATRRVAMRSMNVASFQRHSPAHAVVAEDGFVLREIVEERLDLCVVICLYRVQQFTTGALGTWGERERWRGREREGGREGGKEGGREGGRERGRESMHVHVYTLCV